MPVLIAISTVMTLGRLFPNTPFGKWCHDTTTAKIVNLLAGAERKHAIMLVIGLIAIQAFAVAVPMDIAFLAVIDTATYLDVMMAIVAVAALNRSAGLWVSLRSGIASFTVRNRKPAKGTSHHSPVGRITACARSENGDGGS